MRCSVFELQGASVFAEAVGEFPRPDACSRTACS